jgi:hypothetical protein
MMALVRHNNIGHDFVPFISEQTNENGVDRLPEGVEVNSGGLQLALVPLNLISTEYISLLIDLEFVHHHVLAQHCKCDHEEQQQYKKAEDNPPGLPKFVHHIGKWSPESCNPYDFEVSEALQVQGDGLQGPTRISVVYVGLQSNIDQG